MRKVKEVLLNLHLKKLANNLKKQQGKYWNNIRITSSTLFQGLKQTSKHLRKAFKQRNAIGIEEDNYFERGDGLQTVLYPHELLPIPDNGRYRLHNEMDDCIVCDKCAKICPVDCIDIEPIRAVEDLGKTSDGTPKRIHGAKFDIDMAKCCFCGLCTTVCPTECLTMTNEFNFSEFDVTKHNYEFATLTPLEIIEKLEALENFNKEKEKNELKNRESKVEETHSRPKIKMKPVMKKPVSEEAGKNVSANIKKPKFRPRPIIKKKKED